jgi:rhodanese-related sulfurtransferase
LSGPDAAIMNPQTITRTTPVLPPFFLSVAALAALIGSADAPQILDVRVPEDRSADPWLLPAARPVDAQAIDGWVASLDPAREVCVVCHRGLKLSQGVAAFLRERGLPARALAGGSEGWRAAGQPRISIEGLAAAGFDGRPLVTRRRPKIDRAACPWLVRRFIDSTALILFVEPDQVIATAARFNGVPFDVPDVALTHEGEGCTFDTILARSGLGDHAPLQRLATIIRGADTARPDLAPEAAGLLAISLGLSELAADNDQAMLRHAFVVYDALYAWAARAAHETHTWRPSA